MMCSVTYLIHLGKIGLVISPVYWPGAVDSRGRGARVLPRTAGRTTVAFSVPRPLQTLATDTQTQLRMQYMQKYTYMHTYINAFVPTFVHA